MQSREETRKQGVGFLAIILIIAALLFVGSLPVGLNPTARVVSTGLLILVLIVRIWMHVRAVLAETPSATAETNNVRDFELAALGMFASAAICAHTGFVKSPLFALLYLVAAFTGIFSPAGVTAATVGLGVLATIALFLPVRTTEGAFTFLVVHVVMLPLFAAFHRYFLYVEAQFARSRARLAVQQLMHEAELEARRFRLTGRGANPTTASALSSHIEIHSVLQDLLRLIKRLCKAYTACVLWLADDNKTLTLVEKISDSRHPFKPELPADRGIVSGAIKQGVPVRLASIDWEHRPIPYYTREEPVNAFVAVPVKHNAKVVGLVCADRASEGFSEDEVYVLEFAAGEIVRALLNENLYQTLTKSRTDQQRLAAASEALLESLDLDSVFRTAMQQLEKLSGAELVVMLLVDRDLRTVREARSRGIPIKDVLPDPSALPDETTLARWVLEKRQRLSYPDLQDLPKRPAVFWRREKLRNLRSLLVSPLLTSKRLLGVIALASSKPNVFNDDIQELLSVVLNQIAVSIENALMYEAMERMAITDALTGLYNRRFFKQRLSEMLSRAERTGSKLTLAICDIDHFKRINDTYGHPVGDLVLKRVAKVLAENVRKIDLVARYGGEEFVIALDGAGIEAARRKIEELMERIRAQVFTTELGKFSITMSFGLAVFPNDATDPDELLELADEALYHSKRTGRNRLTLASELKAAAFKQ